MLNIITFSPGMKARNLAGSGLAGAEIGFSQ